MAKRIQFNTKEAKEFTQAFQKLSYRHNAWGIWCDFVTMFACSLSLLFDDENQHACHERAESLEKTQSKYQEDEIKVFDQLCAITFQALNRNADQDFLGSLYMSLDFGNAWTGQFFTPWNVSYMMAQMNFGGDGDVLNGKRYISINDCACGAGCMLLAAASAYENESKDRIPQRDLILVGQDIDRVVALMCYIQLSILGLAGYVAIGDSLSNPLVGSDLNPHLDRGGEIWFTSGWFSPLWKQRRQLEFIRQAFDFYRKGAGEND